LVAWRARCRSGARLVACCTACGRVDIEPGEVVLLVSRHPDLCAYVFACPMCDRVTRVLADDEAITRLVGAGVVADWIPDPIEGRRSPANAARGLPPSSGPVTDSLTPADLESFLGQLASLPTAAEPVPTR
jgi:hypothetical protein